MLLEIHCSQAYKACLLHLSYRRRTNMDLYPDWCCSSDRSMLVVKNARPATHTGTGPPRFVRPSVFCNPDVGEYGVMDPANSALEPPMLGRFVLALPHESHTFLHRVCARLDASHDWAGVAPLPLAKRVDGTKSASGGLACLVHCERLDSA